MSNAATRQMVERSKSATQRALCRPTATNLAFSQQPKEADIMMRREFRVRGLAEPISHYTDAVRYGDLLFISGVAPIDENGTVVGGEDVTAQARQVFMNMKMILEAAGTSFDKVLKVTVFLTEVADRTKVNPVRQDFFGAIRPASTLIGVRELAIPGMKIEVEAIAALR